MFKKFIVISFLISNLFFLKNANAEKEKLPLSRISNITVNGKQVICALFSGRSHYHVAKRVRRRGSVYQRIRGNAAQRAACLNLSNLGTVSLSELPSSADLVRTNSVSSAIRPAAVSGTPLNLPDIPDSSLKDVFWRSDVVDAIVSGSPSAEQCSEFFNSQTDGFSGGLNACYLTQNVGSSFETILQSGTSLCYMKNAPTQANVDAGIVSLISGSLPGGSADNLFSTPSGSSSRLVRVDASQGGEQSQIIFIKVYGSSTNSSNGDNYRFDIWFCNEDSGNPQEYESARVTSDGRFISSGSRNQDGRTSSSTVTAYLKREAGSLIFDNDRTRTAEIFSITDSENFQSSLEVDSSNVIRNKVYNNFNGETRKAYSVTEVSGASIAELKFLQGAYKELYARSEEEQYNFQTGVEYRDTYYAAAPNNTYVSELSAVNLNTDSFYSSFADVDFDNSSFSCSATPDVRVSMNLAHQDFAPIQAACEGTRLDGMDFCNSDSTVQQASSNYFSVCPQP